MNRRNARRPLIRAVLMVLGTLLAVLVLWLVIAVPPLVIRASRPDIRTASPADQLKAENDLRGTLVTVLAGAAVAAGTIVAALNFNLQRRGQVTERFSKAIDQLGDRGETPSEKLDTRLGGIYALEQIAQDSAELHWQIMEVLTAYVREHARWAPTDDSEKPNPQSEDQLSRHHLSTDVQAIVTIISRRRVERDGAGNLLDLGGVDLRRVWWPGAQLQGADFRYAHLEGAWLWGAHLEKAYFEEAHLEDANLTEAHMKGAGLYLAHLQRAKLRGANLEGSDVRGANLEGADLNLANLGGADLSMREFGAVDLQGADLREAHLERADLHGARLQKADLRGAFLQGAVGLTQEQLNSAICDEKTRLPPGLTGKVQD